MSDVASVEIRPEVTMLSVLRHLNYKPWFALAEFIDNALQSSLVNMDALQSLDGPAYRLKVGIRIDNSGPGSIIITDNAAGIASADFPRAFRAAQIPADRTGLSEFGMGMKSAACWFAEEWVVRTKVADDPYERTIRFDVKDIVENKVEALSVDVRDVGNLQAHYTVVSLRGLHHLPQGRTLGKMKAHLESIYRAFLRDGRMELEFNGELLSYSSPKVLNAPEYSAPGIVRSGTEGRSVEWKKEICLDFGGGQSVTGFAALRDVGSTLYAGFSLFRRERLIEGSHDETYRPSKIFKQTTSYPYQRLFGELHLEGFDVSHTKDGFRWEEFEDEFLDLLRDELERGELDLLSQAENYRALPSRRNVERRANAATSAVANYIENDVAPVLVQTRSEAPEVPALPRILPPGSYQLSDKTVCVADGEWNWIITLRTSLDPACENWISLAQNESEPGDQEQTRRIVIDLALAHPFSSSFLGASNENIELFLRVSAAMCISLLLVEDITSQEPKMVLYHFNQLVRGAISQAPIGEGV
ncbi:ATP-binding protein [Isoptericola jiangsuensis]|uniref:ATP-binding protein n=1 Tax=Isoptericola jiangsuensis TaxID=548579 RepID=UPI00386E056C